jgi:hypothetical protein
MFGDIFVLALTGFIFRSLLEIGMNWIRSIFMGKQKEIRFTDLFLGVKDWETQLLMLIVIIVCFTLLGKNPINQDPYFLLGLFLPELGRMLGSFIKGSAKPKEITKTQTEGNKHA